MNDNELLFRYSNLNTYSESLSMNDLTTDKGYGSTKYLIPSFMSDENLDKFVSRSEFSRTLSKLNLTKQLYYDILVLRIKSVDERPRCTCGNTLKFKNLSRGYMKHCSVSCASSDRTDEQKIEAGLRLHKNPVSDKTREKMSKSRKGKPCHPNTIKALKRYNSTKVITFDTRNKMSFSAKLRWSDSLVRKESSEKRIQYCLEHPEFLDKFISHGVYNSERGFISSSKCSEPLYYMSSWEKDFIKILDEYEIVKSISKPPRIPYKFKGLDKIYVPDLLVILENDLKIIVEVKPAHFLMDEKVVAKRMYSEIYCKNNGYKYLTITNHGIYDKSFDLLKYLF